MADGGNVADSSGECVNMLYLASKRREQSDPNKTAKTPDSAGSGEFTVNMDAETSETTETPTPVSQPGPSSTTAHTPSYETPPAGRLTKPSSTSIDESEVKRICPRVNCPEKIVLCLDISQEMEKVTFRSRAGDKFTPIKLIKRAVGIFVHTKHKLNPDHEFALVAMRDQAYMLHDFTNNPDKIIAILQELDNCFLADSCDLSSLFDTIHQNAMLPNISDPSKTAPPYIVRTLLIYGRSHCMPEMPRTESFKALMSSPHFFLDVFYIHEPISNENKCEAVFDAFCKLDLNGLCYIFEASKAVTRIYDSMAKLLPHPLQRPLLQANAVYTIDAKT